MKIIGNPLEGMKRAAKRQSTLAAWAARKRGKPTCVDCGASVPRNKRCAKCARAHRAKA